MLQQQQVVKRAGACSGSDITFLHSPWNGSHWVYTTTTVLPTPLLSSLTMHGKGGLFVRLDFWHESLLFIRTQRH